MYVAVSVCVEARSSLSVFLGYEVRLSSQVVVGGGLRVTAPALQPYYVGVRVPHESLSTSKVGHVRHIPRSRLTPCTVPALEPDSRDVENG